MKKKFVNLFLGLRGVLLNRYEDFGYLIISRKDYLSIIGDRGMGNVEKVISRNEVVIDKFTIDNYRKYPLKK